MSEDLKKRLDNLWAMLEEEGYYVKANTVAVAKNRIEQLAVINEELEKTVEELREDLTMAAVNVYELEAKLSKSEALLAKAEWALVRIAHASDIYSVEANAEDQGADTLAYAHNSTCNLARTTLAELNKERSDEKVQNDE